MKSLNTYINEWKANTNTVSSINTQYFIYRSTIKINKKIKIFDPDWQHFKEYKNKVYIDGKNIEIEDDGMTEKELKPGTYMVEIKDIDNVTNCKYMFFYCLNLVKVPLFNTSKVENMDEMFYGCENLKEVPLFNMSKVNSIWAMFLGCKSLSSKTKNDYYNLYNFDTHKKK